MLDITSVAPALIPIYLLTCVLEFMVVSAFAKEPPHKVFGAVVLANVVSSGLAYLCRNQFGVGEDYITVGTILIEGVVLALAARMTVARGLSLSIAANVVTILTQAAIYSVYP